MNNISTIVSFPCYTDFFFFNNLKLILIKAAPFFSFSLSLNFHTRSISNPANGAVLYHITAHYVVSTVKKI